MSPKQYPSTVCYHISGRADTVEYATAERMADIMNVALDHVSTTSTPYKSGSSWNTEASRLSQTYGFPPETTTSSVIVWNEAGRLVANDASTFQSILKQKYGLECDLTDRQLKAYAAENERLIRQ